METVNDQAGSPRRDYIDQTGRFIRHGTDIPFAKESRGYGEGVSDDDLLPMVETK